MKLENIYVGHSYLGKEGENNLKPEFKGKLLMVIKMEDSKSFPITVLNEDGKRDICYPSDLRKVKFDKGEDK